jgi:hypothetical protein
MTEEEALSMMSPYQGIYGGQRVWEETQEKEHVYSNNNGHNCNIYIRDGKVTRSVADFD